LFSQLKQLREDSETIPNQVQDMVQNNKENQCVMLNLFQHLILSISAFNCR